MEGTSNKETLKLLQISDDSKSLSDLELPEISHQRKRKIRRKTRPRHNLQRQKDVSSENQCNRLIVWIAIFLTCCWLLTLSYMIAVIHSENLRLEVQIAKLSATSQNLPDALQKWHETSKSLEQNQTKIYGKISELQHSLEALNEDFSQYKNKLKEKKDYSKDDKFVADFGAQIAAVSLDVERMKERISEFQKNQEVLKNNYLQLKGNFSEVANKASMLTNNKTANYSEEIKKLKDFALEQIKMLSSNLSILSDTHNQESKILKSDLASNEKQINEIVEWYTNMTSHVTSIENIWPTFKSNVLNLEAHKRKVDDEIAELKNVTAYLNNTVLDMQSACSRTSSRCYDKGEKNISIENNITQHNEDKILTVSEQFVENSKGTLSSTLNTQEGTKSNNTSETNFMRN